MDAFTDIAAYFTTTSVSDTDPSMIPVNEDGPGGGQYGYCTIA